MFKTAPESNDHIGSRASDWQLSLAQEHILPGNSKTIAAFPRFNCITKEDRSKKLNANIQVYARWPPHIQQRIIQGFVVVTSGIDTWNIPNQFGHCLTLTGTVLSPSIHQFTTQMTFGRALPFSTITHPKWRSDLLSSPNSETFRPLPTTILSLDCSVYKYSGLWLETKLFCGRWLRRYSLNRTCLTTQEYLATYVGQHRTDCRKHHWSPDLRLSWWMVGATRCD